MTVEILVVREPRRSPVAELVANPPVMAMVEKWEIGKERHIILTVATDNAATVLESVNSFESVIRAYVCK